MNTTTVTRDALKKLFGISYEVLKKNLNGVTHEESLLQPEADGNCLNWVVGHILSTRNAAMQMLNQQPFWNQEEAALYKRGSEPIKDGSRALNFQKMATDLDRSQELLMRGLSEVSEAQLNSPCPDPSIGETVEEAFFIMQFHETYHAGQTGLLRRIAGREGVIK
jgi:DinB superfamily